MTSHHRAYAGFTLVEIQVALAIFIIATGMAMATLRSVLPSIRVDGQLNRVLSAIQFARDLSIAARRDVEIQFDTANHLLTVQRLDPDGPVPVQMVAFEYRVQFRQFEGMGATPEAFPAADAVDFGEAESLLFVSDGSLVDEQGLPINGTVFLGMEGRPETARAIAVTGTTARGRAYKWSNGWQPR